MGGEGCTIRDGKAICRRQSEPSGFYWLILTEMEMGCLEAWCTGVLGFCAQGIVFFIVQKWSYLEEGNLYDGMNRFVGSSLVLSF